MSEGWKALKIDHAALRRDHLSRVEAALDSVWGETNHPMSLGLIEGGIARWAVENGYGEPVKTARDFLVEAASAGLIVKRGGRWVRPRKPSGPR